MTSRKFLELRINGQIKSVSVNSSDTLLGVLRSLGLTGAKPGCLNGDCGACTVQIDGWPFKSCIMLAVEAVGHQVTTIEGLKGSEMQKAFVRHNAFQCGYCTPGFVMNAHSLIELRPGADEKEIEKWLQSNICRCTGYKEIEGAVKSVLAKKNGAAE